jgi:hypothetical protein
MKNPAGKAASKQLRQAREATRRLFQSRTTEYHNRRRHDITSAGARFSGAGALWACRHMIKTQRDSARAGSPWSRPQYKRLLGSKNRHAPRQPRQGKDRRRERQEPSPLPKEHAEKHDICDCQYLDWRTACEILAAVRKHCTAERTKNASQGGSPGRRSGAKATRRGPPRLGSGLALAERPPGQAPAAETVTPPRPLQPLVRGFLHDGPFHPRRYGTPVLAPSRNGAYFR